MQASQELSKPFPSYERDLASPAGGVGASATQILTSSYKIADIAIGLVSVVGAFMITNLGAMPGHAAGFLALRVSVKNLLLLAFFALAWAATFRAFGLYRNQNRRLNAETIVRLAAASAAGASFAILFVITSRAGAFGHGTTLVFWLLAVCLAVAVRVILNALTGPAAIKHPRQAIILGSGLRALRLYHELKARPEVDYHVLGFVDGAGVATPANEIKVRMLGRLTQLENILVENPVDEVLITLPVKSCYNEIQDAIRVCERLGVESKYLSEIFEPSFAVTGYERLEGFAVTSLKPVVDDVRSVIKRAIDLTGASLGILLLWPLFVILALSIKLTSAGPILFSQERYGRSRRRFRMYKFRTMIYNAEALQPALEIHNEAIGPIFKITEDPRVTRVGAILRRTSLDELPQLFNVLKGEMSLVGPRPLPLRDVSRFDESWLLRRFCVVPGLTGLWQVNGRSSKRFEDWVQQDFHYIDNWSLKLDLKILARTIPAVLRGGGAV